MRQVTEDDLFACLARTIQKGCTARELSANVACIIDCTIPLGKVYPVLLAGDKPLEGQQAILIASRQLLWSSLFIGKIIHWQTNTGNNESIGMSFNVGGMEIDRLSLTSQRNTLC
ncbi:MAG: hypothetical protein H7836_03460 [Magnetococcus sp. YQC-3]